MLEWKVVEDWLVRLGGSALDLLVKIALALVAYFVVKKILKRFCRWLSGQMERKNVDVSVRSFVLSIIRYGVMIFTVVTIVVNLDLIQASSIAAVIASAGVGISLALQGGLSNFAGGVIILLLKPFRAGDYIIVPEAQVEGTVKKIEMYYTTVTSIDNQVIMVPNASLTNNTVTNVTAMDRRKLEVKVGVGYQTDLKKAKEILQQLLEADSRVEEKERQVFVDSLGESAVVLGFRAWVKTEDYWAVKWEMNEKIKARFDEEGIEIPYNQLDVTIRDSSRNVE
ncbi:MAG TPA: mechanosensitive ion channel family protein [Candidatus Scatomonas merdavium]|nr:mechanosensitive ion channel family protein [Candidatus Scatomonas merdavium]